MMDLVYPPHEIDFTSIENIKHTKNKYKELFKKNLILNAGFGQRIMKPILISTPINL
jgi:hypothetical protein